MAIRTYQDHKAASDKLEAYQRIQDAIDAALKEISGAVIEGHVSDADGEICAATIREAFSDMWPTSDYLDLQDDIGNFEEGGEIIAPGRRMETA